MIDDPQYAHRNGSSDHKDPGERDPPRHDVPGLAAYVKYAHLVEEQRPQKAPRHRVEREEWRRQEVIHSGSSIGLGLLYLGERPYILAETGDLREHEQDQKGEGSVEDEVAAGDEHEQRGQVVRNEEVVPWVEDDVVEEVDREVGDAVVENNGLEVGVRGFECPSTRRGHDRRHGHDGRGRAVNERDEAARRLRPMFWVPVPEYHEIPKGVYEAVRGEERPVERVVQDSRPPQGLHHRDRKVFTSFLPDSDSENCFYLDLLAPNRAIN